MNFKHYFIVPRLYPIWCLAVSCILGICWQNLAYAWHYTLLLATIASCLLLVFEVKILAFKCWYVVLYVIIFLASCLSYQRCIWRHETFCLYAHNHTFDITGTVKEVYETGNYRLPYAIKIDTHLLVCTDSELEPYKRRETLLLYSAAKNSVSVADIIKVTHVLLKTPKNKDFMLYLMKESISLNATIQQNQITIIDHPNWSTRRWLAEQRQQLLENFKKKMDMKTYLSFGSIFLGNPAAKKKVESIKNQLKMWGLFHYIARAGLHLAIFISIWICILSFLPIAWLWRQILILLLAGTYFMLTWPSIPFNRAFFTFLMNKTCALLGIRTYYVPSLSLVALVTLLMHPVFLFCLDFQLSFGVTYALAWFNEVRTQRQS